MPSPTTTGLPRDPNDYPVAGIWCPGVGIIPLQGGTPTQDNNGKWSAPIRMQAPSASAGAVALYASNPSATGINTDIAIKWGIVGTIQVNHIMISNNTGIAIVYELDAVTTLGSDILAAGQKLFLDIQVTAIHLQSATSQSVNGTTANNIVVRGWL